MTTPDIGISVVIPTLDRAAHLEYCLASRARQSRPRTDFEVIVIDDSRWGMRLSRRLRAPLRRA
jgi:GT2 family glycosyltransferase